MYIVLKQLGIQTFTSSTLPISFFFHQGVNFDNFIPEADFSFLSNSEYDQNRMIGSDRIGTRILLGQKWQN